MHQLALVDDIYAALAPLVSAAPAIATVTATAISAAIVAAAIAGFAPGAACAVLAPT